MKRYTPIMNSTRLAIWLGLWFALSGRAELVLEFDFGNLQGTDVQAVTNAPGTSGTGQLVGNATVDVAGGAGLPPVFVGGAAARGGPLAGFGTRLGAGFTFSAFVRTSVSDRPMVVIGAENSSTTTAFRVALNQAHDGESTAPHHLFVMVRSERGASAAFAVPLQDLPSGSLGDGAWHHIAISMPAFTSSTTFFTIPRFFFDGLEAHPLSVRGQEDLNLADTFADFTGDGLLIGAYGAEFQTDYFQGSLDEMLLFARALAPNEIADLAAARPTPALPDDMAADADPDEDGQSNDTERRAGTDPRDAASLFAILNTASTDQGRALWWYGTGRYGVTAPFQIERSTNLTENIWEVRATITDRAPDGTNVWVDTQAPQPGPAFYRVTVP